MDFLKFGASETTSYLPTGKYAARYRPFGSVVTVRRTTFLSRFLIVTLAPATAAPEESVTVPTIEPVISCAEAIAALIHRDTNTYSAKEFLLMTPPLVLVSIPVRSRGRRIQRCSRYTTGGRRSQAPKSILRDAALA